MLKLSGVFRRYLVSYLVILLIPSVAGYVSYRTSISVMTSVSIQNSVDQLEKSKELLERRMAEVEGFSRQLAINPDLGVLMSQRTASSGPDVYGIWNMLQTVTTYGHTNDFLKQFYIYFRNYDVVVRPGTASFRPEHFYESYHYENLSYEEWKRQVLDTRHISEIMPLALYDMNGVRTSVLTYMQSLPLDSFNEQTPAVVVVLIDGKLITNLLAGITERYGGWVYVSDDEGRMIALEGQSEREMEAFAAAPAFDNTKTSQYIGGDLVITIRSDTNGWVYRAGIPRQALLENANKIKAISWTVTGTALVVGLLAGLLMAYRNSAPITRLLAVFGSEPKSARNEYDFLQGNIAEMISSNRNLESELRRQQPLILDAFYKRLIAGEFQSRDEIVTAAVQANAGLNGSSGFAGIIQIIGYSELDSVEVLNELNAARVVLRQTLAELAGPVPVTNLGADKVVVLFVSEPDPMSAYTREQIDALLAHLSDRLSTAYRISIQAAMGDRFGEVTEISHSFEQARGTLENAVQPGKVEVVWFGESKLDSATYYYPLDVELRLIGTIKAGELGEAKRILQQIVVENTEQRELPPEMRNQLVLEVKGTLIKLLDQRTFADPESFETVKNRIVGMQTSEPIEAFRTEVEAVMETLCGVVVKKRNEANIRNVEQMKAYIGAHYTDADLTLYRVAEQVERPEKYISQLFKDVTGTNLSDYLEQLRMDRAGELLKGSSHTIDEIAALVGYNSSHSFRRAFKRITGVSPSVYRQGLEG